MKPIPSLGGNHWITDATMAITQLIAWSLAADRTQCSFLPYATSLSSLIQEYQDDPNELSTQVESAYADYFNNWTNNDESIKVEVSIIETDSNLYEIGLFIEYTGPHSENYQYQILADRTERTFQSVKLLDPATVIFNTINGELIPNSL